MVVLRCTQKLLKRLGGETPHPSVAPTTILGDWYANVVSLPLRGKSVILFLNAATYLGILVPGRGSRKTIPTFQDRTVALLERLGLPAESVSREGSEMSEVVLARTESRSLLASMNDIARHLKFIAEARGSFDAINWEAQEMLLSEWPHGPLKYTYPRAIWLQRCFNHRRA